MKQTALSAKSLERLYDLIGAVAPSGFEDAAAAVWRQHAEAFADEVHGDRCANSYASVNAGGNPDGLTIMISGHVDEIGVMITYINDDGYAHFKTIGGWDPTIFPGQRVRLITRNGEILAIVGRRATHLMTYEEQDKPIKLSSLWLDLGVNTKRDAALLVEVGDYGILDSEPVLLPGNRLVSRALDNRIGAFIALEVLERYKAAGGEHTMVAVANTLEETTVGGGAQMAANRVAPDLAFVLDMTFSSDHPDIEKAGIGERKLGSGPAICRGSVTHPRLTRIVRDVAEAEGIAYTLEAVPGKTGTDADAIAFSRQGVPVVLMGVPSRYMHSPNEMISLDDVEDTINLIVKAALSIKPEDLDR